MLNFTQHQPTPEQVEAGVVDGGETFNSTVRELITFDELPTPRGDPSASLYAGSVGLGLPVKIRYDRWSAIPDGASG